VLIHVYASLIVFGLPRLEIYIYLFVKRLSPRLRLGEEEQTKPGIQKITFYGTMPFVSARKMYIRMEDGIYLSIKSLFFTYT